MRDYYDELLTAANLRRSSDVAYSASDATEQLGYWIEANSDREGDFYALIRQHRAYLSELLTKLGATSRRPIQFGYPDLPFVFALRDGRRVLILRGLVADFKVNMVRSQSGPDRARLVADTMLAPIMQPIGRGLSANGIDFVGVVVSYGSENFVSPDGMEALESECLAIVFPATACEQFGTGRISFAELAKRSDWYLADRNTALGLAKIQPPN